MYLDLALSACWLIDFFESDVSLSMEADCFHLTHVGEGGGGGGKAWTMRYRMR